MSDGITFESGGRTWRYKDKPRQITHSEHYLDTHDDGLVIRKWMGSEPTWADYVPVEPVEPESVELDLSTEDAKAVASFLEGHSNSKFAPMIRAQLREQGVSV